LITTITTSNLIAQIDHLGAELCSLKTTRKQNIFGRQYRVLGQALPVLFPIVGTLKNNIYQYKDKTYHLPRHGFARYYI
jgi:galactose mutarotase-like enzyme